MTPIAHLEQIRRQMVEELTQIPEYRALKSMERFIAEMSLIYDSPAAEPPELQHSAESKIAQVIENAIKGEPAPAIMKNAAYIPVHRVA